ncbi:MAG: DNA-binding protein [Gammaproteobacteria bacterium]|nr:DNA-binding protein [Gammaproteobacteria bacterium]
MDLDKKTIFTEKEAAEYIGMSVSFLTNSRSIGNKRGAARAPKFFKNGRCIRYRKSELDRFNNSFNDYENLSEMEQRIVPRPK